MKVTNVVALLGHCCGGLELLNMGICFKISTEESLSLSTILINDYIFMNSEGELCLICFYNNFILVICVFVWQEIQEISNSILPMLIKYSIMSSASLRGVRFMTYLKNEIK